MTVLENDTKLPYDVKVEFLNEWLSMPEKRSWDERHALDTRDRPPPGTNPIGPDPDLYQRYSIRITAGETIWTTEDGDLEALPRCEASKWDLHTDKPIGQTLADMFEAMGNQDQGDLPEREVNCKWQC